MDSKANSNIELPPGFRFHPSDEELIIHYLRNKATSIPIPASIIAEVDLYKFNPWELPSKALFGEDEWYFFTPRERKYPNGARPNRAAASGFWKATGIDKPILTSSGAKSIGVKKALVFYEGRPPKGVKTDWIMHEYRLLDKIIRSSKRKGSMRLDDWVLCRVRQKSSTSRNSSVGRKSPSKEPTSHFLKMDEPSSITTDPNVEMVRNYMYNNCPLLPYIFASQDFVPCTETVSSINFQNSNNDDSFTCKIENMYKGNSPYSVASFDCLFNTPKKEPIEGNQYNPEELVQLENNTNTDVNSCSSYQSEVNSFTGYQWNPMAQYEEFNQSYFKEL